MTIIASGIPDLAYARYFAAMGADWLGYRLQDHSIDALPAISAWVVGPATFVEVGDADADDLFRITEMLKPGALCFSNNVTVPDWYKGMVIRRIQDNETLRQDPSFAMHAQSNILWLDIPGHHSLYAYMNSVKFTTENTSIWLSTDWTPEFLKEVRFGHPECGIVISCQNQVNMADPDFGYFDKLFEIMQN